jgi:BirA family transcriptional regulator, biotin operon repressor / biotin---[acetyl-CoA-carboxylase] ligase
VSDTETAQGCAGHPGGVLGQSRLHLRRTTSTNDHARELALAGAPHGTLVTTSEQTAGRGRQGRRWSAPAGSSVLMSLLLRWPGPTQTPALLPLVAGIAVCDVAGPEALVKWPNDIVLAREDGGLAKLAGILLEGRPQQRWAVLGIGLNVAVDLEDLPAELRPGAASLGLPAAMVEPTLARLLAALASRLGQAPAEILKELRARDALHGREVSWSDGHGQAAGIDEDGQLIVLTPSGERVLLGAGEVHLDRERQDPAV